MAIAKLDYEKLLIWKYGMPPYHFWLNNKELVQKIVKQHNLKPVDRSYFFNDLPGEIQMDQLEIKGKKRVIPQRFWPRPFPGGMRIPHVHLDGEIYIMNELQWKDLTMAKVEEFKAKLENIQNVGFPELMKLTEGFDAIVR